MTVKPIYHFKKIFRGQEQKKKRQVENYLASHVI